MRYDIWKKDDFFKLGDQRIDMDPACVELPEEAHLSWNFDWGAGPYGKVTDIRLEDGVISGEFTFYDPTWLDEALPEEFFRMGGYYRNIEKNHDGTVVTKCRLHAVAVVLTPVYPKMETP